MLGLTLREEFQGRRLKGTAIELTNKNNTGATQIPAADFLKITYPTADVLKALEAVGPEQGRPVVLKGERGQGKSHIMAVLCHAFKDNAATQNWLSHWSDVLGNDSVSGLRLRCGMHVVNESLHRQRYKYLWDLLFDSHPHGNYCKGKWESLGNNKTDIPSDEVMLEMFRHTPTALVLDEFQTWFDGLTNSEQNPLRIWAYNFIQILSEISKEHPENLVLVVSVRNGNTNAFQQIQRVNPNVMDFRGPSAKQDRLNLLLHRLFGNREQVSLSNIERMVNANASEYIRLKESPPAEHEKIRKEFKQSWPFAPHLIRLLEDQVLMATNAQETRDLIRILADLFKTCGDREPLITAADFTLGESNNSIVALLDSVANQHHAKLREKALRNLEAVKEAIPNQEKCLPHLEGVIGALWLHSLADKNLAGADQITLQVESTKDAPLDDNSFQVELSTITENSFNIHEDGNRYIFREEENPRAKLIASARNDRYFQNAEGVNHLGKEIRYVIAGSESVSKYRTVVLPQYWSVDPWEKVGESDRPNMWDDRIPLLVMPEAPEQVESRLGQWLRDNLQTNRNAVRFILPREGSLNVFADRNLLILARAIYLASKWKSQNPEYGRLQGKYEKELRGILKARFDKFALISNWNFQEPNNCQFYIESHRAEGSKIPEAVNKLIKENLFVPEDFEEFILQAAPRNEPVGKILRELKEPRPGGQDCIPWLGETEVKERIIKLCAQGKIAINLRGMEYLQRESGQSEDLAWKKMRGKLGTGKHLDETFILTPQAVPATEGVQRQTVSPLRGEPPSGEGDSYGSAQGVEGSGQVAGMPSSAPNRSNIFSGGTKRTQYSAPPTSALNLLGKAESWGIISGTQLNSLSLRVGELTGAQLQELLRKLPDGMTYELDVEKEDN